MKWLFLNPIKAGNWGGMENWMLNLARGLKAMGDECLVVGRGSSRWPDACKEHSIHFTRFNFGLDLAPWALVKLRGICTDFAPDVGIAKGFRQCRFLRVAFPHAAIGTKMPFATELTDSLVDRWTYRHCVDRVLVDNHTARNAFLRYPWVLPNKIIAVHNGVAEIPERMTAVARDELHRRFGIPEGSLVVAASGRLSPEKRYADALRAFAECGSNCPARFILFGEGPEHDALGQLAGTLGIADRLILAGWHDDARRLIVGADVFIHTSAAEGLPNSVLEALAGGVPVIATDAGGTREVMDNSRAGFLVPCGDTHAMVQHLRTLLQDDRLRREMSVHARDHTHNHFTLDAMTCGVRAAMSNVLQSRQMLRINPSHIRDRWQWIRTADAPFGAEAIEWPLAPSAVRLTSGEKSQVFRVEGTGQTFYMKRFCRRAVRQPAALRNFRLAHRLSLRGASVVPHLAAAWQFNGSMNESLLITAPLPGMTTLDQAITAGSVFECRKEFVRALADWLAHLHGGGVAAHDLKASNILVPKNGPVPCRFALLDLDNGRLYPCAVPHRVVARNFHQVFRSFQKALCRRDVLVFAAAYRRRAAIPRATFHRILAVVERRLHRRGTGYAELNGTPASPGTVSC